MRKIEDIKQEIRAHFIASETLRTAYGLDATKTFDEQFSKVSIEAILTYICAVAIWTFEQVLMKHESDIEIALEQNALCSVPWYHARCLAFQLGDHVELNPDTYRWDYPAVDEAKRIIQFAAVRTLEVEGVTKLRIYVSKADKVALSASEKQAFEAYIRQIGAAGTHFEIISQAPTQLAVGLQIVRNAQVLGIDGKRLSDGVKSVDEAISNYFDGIVYGGVFNRTKLVDAVQAADGVADVILYTVKVGGVEIGSQNIESPGGAFVFDVGNSQINYTV